MRQKTLLTFLNLHTVAYLGAKVYCEAHMLRDSQAQQNFHAIELPNIPPIISFQFMLRARVFGCVCVWLFVGVVAAVLVVGGIINGGRHGHRFR